MTDARIEDDGSSATDGAEIGFRVTDGPVNPFITALWWVVVIAAGTVFTSLVIAASAARGGGSGEWTDVSPDTLVPALVTGVVAFLVMATAAIGALVLHGVRWYLRHP